MLAWLRLAARVGFGIISAAQASSDQETLVRARCAAAPEQKIKVLEVLLQEANEKARLFRAALDVLKKDRVRVAKKAFEQVKSSRKGSSRGLSVSRACHHWRVSRQAYLLKEGPNQVRPTGSEQVWVDDITYLPTDRGVVYPSLVTDAWSRKIVGHHVHDSPRTEKVSRALKVALKSRQTHQALVHHSDRGYPVLLEHYQQIHQRHGISMTDGYDCYQNALAERSTGS